uniref:Uncharacterized protein n=1 Tax=Chaetoceros debilis TaxID=122233 RepID=A0A6S8U7D7_9STRA
MSNVSRRYLSVLLLITQIGAFVIQQSRQVVASQCYEEVPLIKPGHRLSLSCLSCIPSTTGEDNALIDQELLSPKKHTDVYLFSFNKLYESKKKRDLSQASLSLKRWKNYCLGDGGVYFDERPKSLKALNSQISTRIASDTSHFFEERNTSLIETAVLSTCARFEVVVVMSRSKSQEDPGFNPDSDDAIKDSLVGALAEQIIFQECKKSYLLKSLLPFSVFDKPQRICSNTSERIKSPFALKSLQTLTDAMKDEVMVTVNVENVSRRLCLIGAGLQDRPIFRPFSSRDAHVMAQIKRTADGAVQQHSDEKSLDTATATYCKILFDAALQCGKAARSSKAVPILDELRSASNGADGPPELSKAAALSAVKLAVNPAVAMCTAKLKAMEATNDILRLREGAAGLTRQSGRRLDSVGCAPIRNLLHEPTIRLREGKYVDIEKVLNDVQVEIDRIP